MDALEEKEEEEQREEELKTLEISDHLQDMEMKESVEQVCVPSDVPDFDWSSIDMSQLPPSYKTNSWKEKQLLHIADHFFRQYVHLCPDRKPLFLHPANECGVEKFVSTTLRPTLLPYAELYHWAGCASFVSDYLTMEPLKSPITPPSLLYSPTTILKHRRGNCFDFSMLLCSMLIGAGYDAYCVHGYATREVCAADETLKLCPLLRKPQEKPKERMKKSNKYRVKPPPELQSKFEFQQEAKAAETEGAEQNKEKQVDEVPELEKPKCDPLHGLRVHAWVLVLSGKKEVPETFFINPFTGDSHSTTDEHFLGIESVWNHRNYWVNMQNCWNGCKDLIFDLADAVCWEVMLLGSNQPLQLLSDAEEENELSDKELDDMQEKQEGDKSFDMPPSWVAPIQISPREFETCYSEGSKEILYKKAKLEKWAPYVNGNGLVKRLTTYTDSHCTEVVEVREWFENREDMLHMREVNKLTQLTTDHFSPGHLFCLKAHTYTSLKPETEYTMEFYHEARVDGLQRRVETSEEMTEYFVGRDDFLHVRNMQFGKRQKKIHLVGTRTDSSSRPIVQIKECFHRNPEKPADEDVAERIFLITEDMIQLTYHLKDNYITASKKDFFKAAEGDRKGNEMVMSPEMCIVYQAGSSEEEEKLLHLYKLLQQLTVEEKQLKQQVQQSEAEVLNILKVREDEETNIKLSVSIYNTERNKERRQQYEAMKKTREDELWGPEEQELDYLAPFLIRIGHREKMTKGQALQVRSDCLADLKQRLVNKANIIQARLEKAVELLQQKDEWFQKNQTRLSAEEESDFLTRRSETTFHIQILAARLKREKEAAPQKYFALEEKLRRDPRLAEHLGHGSFLHPFRALTGKPR